MGRPESPAQITKTSVPRWPAPSATTRLVAGQDPAKSADAGLGQLGGRELSPSLAIFLQKLGPGADVGGRAGQAFPAGHQGAARQAEQTAFGGEHGTARLDPRERRAVTGTQALRPVETTERGRPLTLGGEGERKEPR